MKDLSACQPLWLKLAFMELRASRAFSFSFVLNLSLGLVGFLTLDVFKAALHEHLETRSKSILAADLALSASRPLSTVERQAARAVLPKDTVASDEIDLYSMAAGSSGTARLVEIRAIDAGFPFYGALQLKNQGRVGDGPNQSPVDESLIHTPTAWLYPELLQQLKVKMGDFIKIGDVRLRVADIVTEDPSMSSVGLALAPKIYIGKDSLAKSALVGRGSRIYYNVLYKLPAGTRDVDVYAKKLRETLQASDSLDVHVRTHRSASEQLNRLLNYLNDYLGLVALVALFLAGVGAAYLFRSFLGRRYRDIAILLSLGVPLNEARRIYIAQLAALGGAATLVTLAVTLVLLPILPHIFGNLLPAGLKLHIAPSSIGLALLLGVGGSWLFCLPLLVRLTDIKPAHLFKEEVIPPMHRRQKELLGWLPALAVYWLLAIWQAHSWRIGSLFVLLFLMTGWLLATVSLVLLRFINRQNQIPSSHLIRQQALLNLARHRGASTASFLAIGLGALLLNVIPQLRQTLAQELDQPDPARSPSLFLFDIQEDEVEPLQTLLRQQQAQLAFISPMIRARLTAINGQPLAAQQNASAQPAAEPDDRDTETTQRWRNRGYNLTYRGVLAPSETIVAGKPFSGRFPSAHSNEEPAQISLEENFANRLAVKLGDTLAFDVQGVEVTGRIVNLRKVRWTSFEPNFFVEFQPGVLEDAPKTFVAAIPAAISPSKNSNLRSEAEKINLQNQIVSHFSNISIVDVGAAIRRILSIVEQISTAVTAMALLTLAAGLAVLFSIARNQAQLRQRDVTLFKVLGASFATIRSISMLEFAVLGAGAGILGALLSIIASYVLATELFEDPWRFSWAVPGWTSLAIVILCTLTGLGATNGSLKRKPLSLLHPND